MIIIYLFYIKNIRFCLVYNLFHIPCAGCGLTRSIISLFQLDVINSIRYNMLGIPIVAIFVICNIWYLMDIITKRNTLETFMQKHIKEIITVTILFFLISTYKNIFNQLLY